MKTENQRQRTAKIGVISKYNAYLDEVYKEIEKNGSVSIKKISSSYKIGTQVSVILQELKIIKKISRDKYIWIGAKPSQKLVELILEISRKYSYQRLYPNVEVGQKEIDFKTPVTKPIEKPIVKPVYRILNPTAELKVEKNKVTVSLLWGMFKYQKD